MIVKTGPQRCGEGLERGEVGVLLFQFENSGNFWIFFLQNQVILLSHVLCNSIKDCLKLEISWHNYRCIFIIHGKIREFILPEMQWTLPFTSHLPARCQHLRPQSSFQCTPLRPDLQDLMDSCRPRNHGCFHTHACQTVCLLRMYNNCMSAIPIKLPCVVFSPKLLISHVPVVRNGLYYRSVKRLSGSLSGLCLALREQLTVVCYSVSAPSYPSSEQLDYYCFFATR